MITCWLKLAVADRNHYTLNLKKRFLAKSLRRWAAGKNCQPEDVMQVYRLVLLTCFAFTQWILLESELFDWVSLVISFVSVYTLGWSET
jgi:hypothetical protein